MIHRDTDAAPHLGRKVDYSAATRTVSPWARDNWLPERPRPLTPEGERVCAREREVWLRVRQARKARGGL